MNQEKLKKLQAQVRIGGKGTPRRKRKFVHATADLFDEMVWNYLITGGKVSIEEDDEVPELVDSFDEASKEEVPVNVADKEDKGRGKENDSVSAGSGEVAKGDGPKEAVLSSSDKRIK